METINQTTLPESINVVTILDSNTTLDSSQFTQDVETEDSISILKTENAYLQQNKTTAQENETETTKIQLPLVNTVADGNDSDEEPMDIRSVDDEVDDDKKLYNEVQQVDVLAKPQSPQLLPKNVEDNENNIMNDNGTLSNEAKTFKHENTKEDEEDLLESDNEYDNTEEIKRSLTTDLYSISMEQEEELLKSEDEEISGEEEENEEHTTKSCNQVNLEEEVSNESRKLNDNRNKIDVHDFEKVQNTNESNVNHVNHNEVKIDGFPKENSSSEKFGWDQSNDIKKYKMSDKRIEEHSDEEYQTSERKYKSTCQSRLKKNAENHRILYQFCLDDDSSSGDEFQNQNSSSKSYKENKEEALKNSAVNQQQFYGELTTDIKDVTGVDEKVKYDRGSSRNKLENGSKITTSESFKLVSRKSEDDEVSGNESGVFPSFSSQATSDKYEEVNSEIERTKHDKFSTLQSPQTNLLKSRGSNIEQDDDVNGTKQNSITSSDSLNSTSDDLYIANESDNNDQRDSNTTNLIGNILSNNQKSAEENKLLPLKLNGEFDSENEYKESDQITNHNDSYVESHDETRISKSRRTSLDSNMSLSPRNEKLSNVHKEINKPNLFVIQEPEVKDDADKKMQIESDNESRLMNNDSNQEYYNDGGNDNEETNEQRFHISPPFAISNEEREDSRSSIASSASYSTTTSSSQHLVIDHPMEDIKEDKIQPLKISLKRKFSNSSEEDDDFTGPQQKQAHLHDQNEEQSNFKFMFNEGDKKVQSNASSQFRITDENTEIAVNTGPTHQDTKMEADAPNSNILALEHNQEKVSLFNNNGDLAEPSSLLLQQLNKPLVMQNTITDNTILPLKTTTPPTFTPVQLTTTPSPPALPVVSTQIPTVPLPPPKDTGVTKFFCFKCKTGSFDTFAALSEHQAICLVSSSPFPFNKTTIQTPKLPPVSSPRNLNASPTAKLDELSEFKGNFPAQNQQAVSVTKRRYYKCTACNTFHENWNLFVHIREHHNRHTCLYCLRFFPTAEKLALHLEIKHDLEQNHFNNEEALRSSIPVMEGYALEARLLMCCTCQHIFMNSEQFSQHDCTDFMKSCLLCGQKGRHTNQCKAHPDSKRFSKLKKKKHIQPPEPLPPTSSTKDRSQMELAATTSVAMPNHNINPTTISNSNSNCDIGHAKENQRPAQNEDSNSSSNMVIDESCNISHTLPARIESPENCNAKINIGLESRIEQHFPPDRQSVVDKVIPEPPLKLVVPKFKLRVPKEFQKSVDEALSTSDSEEEIDDDQEGEEHEPDDKVNLENENDSVPKLAAVKYTRQDSVVGAIQNSFLAESTPANSQDTEIERNSTTESATEAGNSQDDPAYENVGDTSKAQNPASLLEDDDSLDEPNSNLVRIMQEIEKTKLDIQRTKKTSIRHNKSFALLRHPNNSQTRNTNNWSPTPPSSPNSRLYVPRRPATSQNGEEQPQKTCFLPPPSPVKQLDSSQERRDTIGSDMMDIDETITSQPTPTIFCNKLRPLISEDLNNSSESIEEKSCIESMNTSQTTNNEIPTSLLENEKLNEPINQQSSLLNPHPKTYVDNENELEIEDTPKGESADKLLTQTAGDENNSHPDARQQREDEAENDTEIDVCDNEDQEENTAPTDNEKSLKLERLPPTDGIEVANDDTIVVDMKLDRPLDKYECIDFLRICLKAVYPLCLFCNHARRIAVNGKSLALHMIGQHRFTAAVDSITAEELLPATIVTKLKSFLPELEEHFFNSNSYCTYGDGAFRSHFNERIFECFQCRFVTSTHKELYLHNRKMHLRTAILCFMCRANFFSFSEILCHICPGVPNKVSVFDVKFRCCLCELDKIPSPFRLMVHLRKKHFACDVCLEDCRDQSKLSSHVWKHKLHHLCYRCGIAYRNKLDITKHLFWKHGTESIICKRCLQKRWRHVYHFCIPPPTFVCEVCNLCFSKAMYLRVHKRLHSGDLRYPCTEDNCEERFISRKLLLKHVLIHQVSDALKEKSKDPETLKNNENEFGLITGIGEEDLKMHSDLQAIKEEVKEIKREPLDVSEIPSQKIRKDENSTLNGKKEMQEKLGSNGEKDFKGEEIKENKSLGSNEPRKKRKKSKRSKELLEDLNLTAPNLSESDSSDDSDSDSDSKTKSEIGVLPRIIPSPPSEIEIEQKDNKSPEPAEPSEPGQVLEIWKNFLKAQQGSSKVEELERLNAASEEKKHLERKPIHVACSDHDYCKMEDPEIQASPPASKSLVRRNEEDFKKPAVEMFSTPESSPLKKKQSKSPRRSASKRSDASSSSSGSSSSSDSSCSCGSNCSCSSSDSNSSSSSSSSGDSDSSLASNNSMRKRHRKKSERDRIRKRSESMSPLKQRKFSVSTSDVINVDDEDVLKVNENISEKPPSPPKEPLFYESDLETNESETDEEFYDEHPQKLANEMLAQKRAQLMAQTRLSPSHNYDIVENSRPSTPSLPEEMATNEKPKIKVKKKKRDRKNSYKIQGLHTNHVAVTEHAFAPAQTALELHQPNNSLLQVPPQQPSSPVASLINSVIDSHHTQASNLYNMPQNILQQPIYTLPPPTVLAEQSTLTPRPLTMTPYGSLHRMSEGSSCSDADGSLKRSKRQRRPNKFYGYTSDDENLLNGPPLMIGTRAFKPQPPPQLTWRKEDLPTPSKSILNNKNKLTKTPKTPAACGNIFTNATNAQSSKKKSKLSLSGGEKSARKRPSKKKDSKGDSKFPPIPTLKIRPSEIGLNTSINQSINYNSTDDTSSDDDNSKDHSLNSNSFNSSFENQVEAAVSQPIILPSLPPAPPVPQTKAFNHRIPPALLPNPDFATLQYFKANNIRYPIRPPAGARQPRDGESVYCYCRCPYDEVSEMIACDGENCLIEWFHFECVGIMVAPQGKWFCAECRPKYSEELYPSSASSRLLSNV